MNRRLKRLRLTFALIISVLVGVGLSHPVKAAAGGTIKETFPDTNFAQAIADKVASGNVNAEFTQTMVDNTTKIDFKSANI